MLIFYRVVESLLQSHSDKFFWTGFDDKLEEGTFRMLNSSVFDPNAIEDNSLYKWGWSQPNNNNDNEHCVIIDTQTMPYVLNDFNCDAAIFFEYKIFGLCEIPRFTCS